MCSCWTRERTTAPPPIPCLGSPKQVWAWRSLLWVRVYIPVRVELNYSSECQEVGDNFGGKCWIFFHPPPPPPHTHTHTRTPSPHTLTGIPNITPNSTTITHGQSGSFVCQALGDPLPAITWFKACNQITVDTPRVVLSAGRLTITNVTLEDDGYYTCRAVFPRGTTEAQAFLDVMCKHS